MPDERTNGSLNTTSSGTHPPQYHAMVLLVDESGDGLRSGAARAGKSVRHRFSLLCRGSRGAERRQSNQAHRHPSGFGDAWDRRAHSRQPIPIESGNQRYPDYRSFDERKSAGQRPGIRIGRQ